MPEVSWCWTPITCEAPPSPATAPDTSAQRNCSRPTAMPLNSAAFGACPAALIRTPVEVRAQHDAGHHDDDDREPEAPVHAAVREQGGQVVAGAQPVGVGEPALGVAPRPVEQALDDQQRDRVEQQRRDDLVDPELPLQPGRHDRPEQPAERPREEPERQGRPRPAGREAPCRRRSCRWRRAGTGPRRRCSSSRRGRRCATAMPVNSSGVAVSSTSCMPATEVSGVTR